MAIFSEEFYKIAERIGNGFYKDFSNSLSTWWLHVIILLSLIMGYGVMSQFGIVGINAWWEQYTVLNPNVVLEQTTMYWFFIIADRLLFLATLFEFCYVWILFIVWSLGDMKRLETKATDKKTPTCPNCKNDMDVIRKGTNKGIERFCCKSCGKYFQKK